MNLSYEVERLRYRIDQLQEAEHHRLNQNIEFNQQIGELMKENARLKRLCEQWERCAIQTDRKLLDEQRDHNKTMDKLIALKKKLREMNIVVDLPA